MHLSLFIPPFVDRVYLCSLWTVCPVFLPLCVSCFLFRQQETGHRKKRTTQQRRRRRSTRRTRKSIAERVSLSLSLSLSLSSSLSHIPNFKYSTCTAAEKDEKNLSNLLWREREKDEHKDSCHGSSMQEELSSQISLWHKKMQLYKMTHKEKTQASSSVDLPETTFQWKG